MIILIAHSTHIEVQVLPDGNASQYTRVSVNWNDGTEVS